ncbi:unnamed protein product [Rotaria sordida]|uniref:Uncharacterized protein n=1 Tax=Rotaria sordida TaxID=392033 RepID=A0A814S1E0_9BILA|nr:unnamed protein product [Rotaria sordida]CAF1255667.1 unnamed protein product [Rotaria sordida]
MDSCKCPITNEIFEDPVVGDDGHTYERKAVTEWLTRNGTSPITRQPMNIDSLKPNYTVKKMIEELRSVSLPQQAQYRFELDVDIGKTRARPLFQGFGKSIYEVEWINRKGPPIILLKIDGAKANREASFYVQLGCHPNIVRTFGLVQCNPGSVMLLQECAPHGDLSELLRENGFKPTERVLRKIFQQICDAMICLVDNGITHGDLACRNVLVFRLNPIEPKENLVKLTDFGLTRGSTVYSTIDSPSMSTMTIIPVRYAAPEILQNPDRIKQPLNQAPDDIVYIPCEYCKALIDLSNWSIHIDTCRENEENRLANLAQIISQEPITAKFPCEYCQQLCSADELETHEVSTTMR